MKYIILFLAILIFLTGSAQDSQLAGVDWYLQNLVINGQNYPPPYNSEVQNVEARFYAISNGDSADAFTTFVCNTLYGLLIYDEFNDSFSFTYQENTLITCTLQVNEDYEGIYFNFFYAPFGSLYNYSITTETNGHKTLVLISPTGDQAIYGDNPLSNQDFSLTQFSLHPNPAQTELFITAQNTTGNLKIKILNIEGRLLNAQNITLHNKAPIDVSQLVSGVYFLKIEDGSGNTTIKKFIKE